MTDNCNSCRFGHKIPWSSETSEGHDLFCRLDPPEFIHPNGSALKPVRLDGWCGKHESTRRRVSK